jgi:serine/threonine protein kinase
MPTPPDHNPSPTEGSDDPTPPTRRLNPDEIVPPRIDEFEIGPVLGGGGMGLVFKAYDHQLNRPVALKIMLAGVVHPTGLDRFRNEIRTLAALDHPNIAVVYRSGGFTDPAAPPGELRERPFYAMQFLPGARSITGYARDHATSLADRLALFMPVCEAIGYAHARGVIHRDLKPGNVLVTPQGQPKVIDFGVSLTSDAATQAIHHLREEGRPVGTAWYMSPEQCVARSGAIDERSDVYALGVMLYELLLGRLPHEVRGRPTADVQRMILLDPPADPLTINPALPAPLRAVLLKCLEKEPARRYANARELAEALVPIIASERKGRSPARTLYPVLTAIGATLLGGLLGPHIAPETAALFTQRLRAAMFTLDDQITRFDHARLIAISSATDWPALVAREKLAGDPADLATRRALHARLLDRLARLDVRAVAWDIDFKDPSAFDDLLRRAASITFPSADLVFGVPEWTNRAFGRAEPDRPAGLPGRRGGVTIGTGEDPYVELAVVPTDMEPMPSLALGALTSWHWPGRAVALNLTESPLELALRPAGQATDSVFTTPPIIAVPLGGIFVEDASTIAAGASAGLRVGDRVAVVTAPVPSEAVLKQATVNYQAVFEADDAQLRRWVDGRAIVVGEIDNPGDVHPGPGGRLVPGCTVHLTAIELLIRWCGAKPAGAMASIIAAGLGSLVVLLVGRSSRLWLAATALATVAISAWPAAAAALHAGAWVSPLAPILGAGFALAIWGILRGSTGPTPRRYRLPTD